MKVFFDASALVPLVYTRDQWHFTVRRHLALLDQGRHFTMVTSNWTLYEALTIVKRAGHHRVVELHRYAAKTMDIVTVDPVVESEALRRFVGWSDKTASVVDHANLLAALASGCDAILTFDADFLPIAQGTGIRVLGAGQG
ncbi:MAG: type II toxin-antitoxin system VapC family toxin [Dehalococcoidia bacterium]|nr:type II toxin-antitoxin system VapC family toxin [Dehalococcoidia bacterium]